MIGKRGDEEYTINDDRFVLEFYAEHKDDDPKTLAYAVCRNTQMWGEDLSEIPGFADAVADYLTQIKEKGMYEVLKSVQ